MPARRDLSWACVCVLEHMKHSPAGGHGGFHKPKQAFGAELESCEHRMLLKMVPDWARLLPGVLADFTLPIAGGCWVIRKLGFEIIPQEGVNNRSNWGQESAAGVQRWHCGRCSHCTSWTDGGGGRREGSSRLAPDAG